MSYPRIQPRAPQDGITRVTIDLGTGSRAYTRWKELDAMLPLVKQLLRDVGQPSKARDISDWQQMMGYRVDRAANHWRLEMDGEQWQALSLGLRHGGTKGSSMYDWMLNHRETYTEQERGSHPARLP